jgi:hypothetical protein
MSGRLRLSTSVSVVLSGWVSVACTPYGNLPEVAAARVGCVSSDVVTSDMESKRGMREWAMQCNGQTWRCAATSAADAFCEPADLSVLTRAPAQTERPPAPRWTTYESATCDMGVEFPGKAVASTEQVQTPNGSQLVETRTLDTDGADRVMVASCTRVGPPDAELSRLLDVTRDALLKGTGAKLVEERASIGGRELRLSLENHEIRARFVVMSGTLLSLIVAPVDAFDEQSVERFLESPRSLARAGTVVAKRRAD